MLSPARARFFGLFAVQRAALTFALVMSLHGASGQSAGEAIEEIEMAIPVELVQKWDERENLRAILRSDASTEEKQSAFLAWQAALMQEAKENEAHRPQPNAEEKEALWQQRLAHAQAVSPEQHAALLEQKNFSASLEALKAGDFSAEEKSLRLTQLVQNHQHAMEIKRADLVAAARAEQAQKPPNPFAEATRVQRAQLQEILKNGNEAQKQQAIENFRNTLQTLRESRSETQIPAPEGVGTIGD